MILISSLSFSVNKIFEKKKGELKRRISLCKNVREVEDYK